MVKVDHVELCCAHLQLHVSQRAADGVNGAAEIRAGVSLCQVVHQKPSLPLLDFDAIPLRLCLHQNLLLKDEHQVCKPSDLHEDVHFPPRWAGITIRVYFSV